MKILRIIVAIIAIAIMQAACFAGMGFLYSSGFNAGTHQCEASYQGEEVPEAIGPI